MFSSLRTAGAAAAAAAASLVGSPTVHAEGYAIQEHWRVSLVRFHSMFEFSSSNTTVL